jgi:hypothetical protein
VKKIRLSRRTMLRGMLGTGVVTLGLPLLDVMLDNHGEAHADGSPLPVRFGLFWWGNGNVPELWNPIGLGAGYELTDQTAALEDVKDDLTFVTGMAVKVQNIGPHSSGRAGLLTGMQEAGGGTGYKTLTFDQRVAAEIGAETAFPSLESTLLGGTVTAQGEFTPMQPARTPHELFAKIFNEDFIPPGAIEGPNPALVARRSVLDAVFDDASRLSTRVSARDRLRIEEHMDSVRAIELRLEHLQNNPPNMAACAQPDEPPDLYPVGEAAVAQMYEINELYAHIHAMALACDQTRVFSHVFSGPVNDAVYPGTTEGHHARTHFEPKSSGGGYQLEVFNITKMIMKGLGDFVSVLGGVNEGTGRLLDNMVMLATSEVSEGLAHAIDRMPIILAGSAGGQLLTGHHVSAPTVNTSNLILSLADVLGVPMASFGTGDAQSSTRLASIMAGG